MRVRFQADADFNQKIVAGLRRREPLADVLNAHQGGIVGLADPDVLATSAASGRVLLSHHRKTMPAHFANFLKSKPSPGLIVIPQGLGIGEAIEQLLLIWWATDADEWRNHMGFLPI